MNAELKTEARDRLPWPTNTASSQETSGSLLFHLDPNAEHDCMGRTNAFGLWPDQPTGDQRLDQVQRVERTLTRAFLEVPGIDRHRIGHMGKT